MYQKFKLVYLIVVSVLCVVGSKVLAENSVQQTEHQAMKQAAKQKLCDNQTSGVWQDMQCAFKMGWVEGKAETAILLNKHLNPFDINVTVSGEVALLTGTVPNQVEKELAQEVVLSVKGIESIDNQLAIDPKVAQKMSEETVAERAMVQRIKDATITAAIKAQLISSQSIKALDINVDTLNQAVTLKGKVQSEAEKELVEQLVRNHKEVQSVTNQLEISL